jgi:hypothetical protein
MVRGLGSKQRDVALRGYLDAKLKDLSDLAYERDRRYEQRFTDSAKAVDAALAAAKEAVIKAETATEKRFESVNEFRQTLSDQTRHFITREVFDTKLDLVLTNIQGLKEGRANDSGARLVRADLLGYLIGGGGLTALIVVLGKAGHLW